MEKKKNSIAFYIASSNADLLKKIDRIMSDKGLMSFRDQSGRYHYLIDGRRGAPYAAKKIDDAARIILRSDGEGLKAEELNAEFYVDAVLSCYHFDQSLKGFIYLRYILIQITLAPSLNRSLSKNLYPMCAKAYSVNAHQVERNIRYCLQRLKEEEEKGEMKKIMPLVFREGQPVFQNIKARILIEGEDNYPNAVAIRTLNQEIQQMIRRDHCRRKY